MSLKDSIKKGVGMVHGTGEAIRGEFNAAVDDATGDKASATRNKEIAQKGVDEWDRGYRGHALGSEAAHGVGHNVPTTTAANVEAQNTTHSTSTNYGPHDSNIGNKLDPRYDSDMDHRGTATNSTNAGPHSSNVANKVDPRVDSDMDHRANPTSGVGPNTTYNDSTNAGPHRSNFANKLDPTVDSDMDHRANPGSHVGGTGY
ncbi:hypothetical protein EK21DRAFT_58292 [Setomelanomma holmii]|uniref:Uncharacterized protein n=1 Tax=Setomelanomma holmii TaxID=210430 RepID=A0A9P4HF24_9PLEO|nr:hypothetical protein EK21DRAFT_58292 [Setomelanomma holmii]